VGLSRPPMKAKSCIDWLSVLVKRVSDLGTRGFATDGRWRILGPLASLQA